MIFIVLSLGFILRIVFLNQSFWLDEATTATVVQNFSFGEIVTKFSPGDFHPPLYYLAAKFWSMPFGVSEVSLRFLSVLFTVLTIWVVYLIGKKLSGRNAGLLSAILLATAPLHIYYSQEARMYALEVLLVSVAVYLFAKERWVWFGVFLAILGAVDYLPLLIIPVFWAWGLSKRKNISWWSRHTISYLLLAIFYAWWSPYFMSQLKSGSHVNPRWTAILGISNLKNLALIPVKFMLGRINFDNRLIYGLVVVAGMLLFGYLLLKTFGKIRKFENSKIIFWLWLIVPLVLAFGIGFWLPVFSYFRLVFVLPAFYILAAIGLSKVKEKLFLPLLLLAVVLNIFFSLRYLLNEKFHREDWRGAVSYIEENSDDAVALFPANSQMEAYNYYSNGKVPAVGPTGFDPAFAGRPAGQKVWLVRYVQDVFDPNDTARFSLEDNGYSKIAEHDFNGVVVWEYEEK